jgi:hypothetical protein
MRGAHSSNDRALIIESRAVQSEYIWLRLFLVFNSEFSIARTPISA